MAPLPPEPPKRPSARTLRHQRITGQIHPLLPPKTFRPEAAVSDTFLSSKRDKRLMKHSSFVSRVASSSRVAKPARRTRRPGRKLKADLEGLADALPDLEDQDGDGEATTKDGRVRHRSLRSKRGALKRKERVVKGEMERFGASMARLAGVPEEQPAADARLPAGLQDEQDGTASGAVPSAPEPAAAATSNRWAALRGYISSTMEQNPAFAGKS